MNEDLKKSVDALLDELFAEETVEKSDAIHQIIGEPKQSKFEEQKAETLADQVKPKESSEEDEKNGKKRGRPDDLSQMSMRSPDGESKGSYDASITSPSKEPAHETTVAKSETSKEIEELKTQIEELKKAIDAKAKAEKDEEDLQKANQEKADLIKSAVEQATSGLKKENDELKKSMKETADLIKAMSKRPKPRQSISSVEVIEKSIGDSTEPKHFSKSEMLDAAEELCKSNKLTVEDVIELEDTGNIFSAAKRQILENYIQSK